MPKYRLKLENGRVIGPFESDQVKNLISEKKLGAKALAQTFPGGDWLPLSRFDFDKEDQTTAGQTVVNLSLRELLEAGGNKKTINQSPEPSEPVKKSATEKKVKSKDDKFVEFDYRQQEKSPDLNKTVTETKVDDNKPKTSKASEKTSSTINLTPTQDKDKSSATQNPEISLIQETKVDKTVIVKTHKRPRDVEKTMLKHGYRVGVIEEKKDEADEIAEAEESKEIVPATPIEEERTVVGKFDIAALKKDVVSVEKELEVEEKKVKEEEIKRKQEEEMLDAKAEEGEDDGESTDEDSETGKKKPIKPIIALVFILLLGYLFFDEEEPPKDLPPVPLVLTFPIAGDVLEPEKAKLELEKGNEARLDISYLSTMKASIHYVKSMSHQFKDNPSLGKLIITYSELLTHSKKKQEDSKIIFQLIKIAQSKLLLDVDVALGVAIFYLQLGKYHSAKNTIENFLRIENNKPSKDLFCTYLGSLIKVGDLVKASEVKDKMANAGRLPITCFNYFIEFYQLEDKDEEVKKYILDGLKLYPNSVLLLLKYADYFLKLRDVKNYTAVMLKIRELQAERSPIYYSRYLEHMGVLSAIQGDTAQASVFFNLALAVFDSNELRSKLASLKLGGSKGTESLILESKIKYFMNKASIEIENRDWKKALNYAIQATDLSAVYLPSHLLLARIQIELGYFESVINSLTEKRKEMTTNDDISKLLILANLEAFKLPEARREIQLLAQTPFAKTGEYSYLLGEFYEKSKNITFALRFYQEAIDRDPTNDFYYYKISKLLLLLRKYKDCQKYLSDAIYLDPVNLDYRLIFAKILYELNSSDVAIGYLRELLTKHDKNPKLIGEIAIYYYKSGKMKDFNDTKAQLNDVGGGDRNFLQFMIDASKEEGKIDNVVTYSRELLKRNEGDLETRMSLAEFLYDTQKYQDAKIELEIVKNKLPGYPKVHYFLSLVYLKLNDLEKAKEYAELEIQNSPDSDLGFYIKGEIAYKNSDFQEAILNFEKAIQKNPQSVEALKGLGLIKFQQSFFAEARELYLRALKENNSDAESHKYLGQIYKAMGQSSLAIEEFEVYLKLDPSAADAATINAEINALK